MKRKSLILGVALVAASLAVLAVMRVSDFLKEKKVEQFFADSVIVGDSVAAGYQNYCAKSDMEGLRALHFLAAVSFSAHSALCPVSEDSVHPVYQGEQRPIWESIERMGVKHVFLLLGLNDLGVVAAEDICTNYQEVADRILARTPDVSIHIMSVTYTMEDAGKGELNNEAIRSLNMELKALAERNGWGFVDLAEPLSDGRGNLKPEYCSDGYVHQTRQAYRVWTDVLKQYVREQVG